MRWINLSFNGFCCLQLLSGNIPASVNIGWHCFGSVFVRVLSCRKSHYLIFLPWECSLQIPVPKEERARNNHPSMLTQEENTVPNVYTKVVKGLAQPTVGVGQFSSNIHAQNSCLQHAPERGSWVNSCLKNCSWWTYVFLFVCLFFFFHGVFLVFFSKILKKNKSKSRRNEVKKKEIYFIELWHRCIEKFHA